MKPSMQLVSIIMLTLCFTTYSSLTLNNHTINANASIIPINQPRAIWNHLLILTYGVNFCKAKPCYGRSKIDFEGFSIHGLWPTTPPQVPKLANPFSSTAPPPLVDCNLKSKLRSKDVSTLGVHLQYAWPSIQSYQTPGQALSFWKYEWRKHGTCTPFDKLMYFRRSLALYRTVNADYVTGDLQFPMPYINCHTKQPYGELLLELIYCVDSAGYTPVDCDNFYSDFSNCNGPIYLLKA